MGALTPLPRSDREQRLVVVADALTLQPGRTAVCCRLDCERAALIEPGIWCVAHVQASLTHGHPTVTLEDRSRDCALSVVSSENHRPVVDESLEGGDPLVGGRPVGIRMREIAGELFAEAVDREGDALGKKCEEIPGRCMNGLGRSVIAEDRLL